VTFWFQTFAFKFILYRYTAAAIKFLVAAASVTWEAQLGREAVAGLYNLHPVV
jgi:hypothetical protein